MAALSFLVGQIKGCDSSTKLELKLEGKNYHYDNTFIKNTGENSWFFAQPVEFGNYTVEVIDLQTGNKIDEKITIDKEVSELHLDIS